VQEDLSSHPEPWIDQQTYIFQLKHPYITTPPFFGKN